MCGMEEYECVETWSEVSSEEKGLAEAATTLPVLLLLLHLFRTAETEPRDIQT